MAAGAPAAPTRAGFVLLRTRPEFRRLWLARVVSFLGDAAGLVALIIFTAEDVGTGAAVGLLLLAGDVTPTLVSPVLGAVADRFGHRGVMVACELAQAAVVMTIAWLTPPLAALLALVAVQAVFAWVFGAASRTAVSGLVDDSELEAANALVGLGTHGLEALGPLLAGGLLLFLDARWVLALDGVTFLVSAALLAGVSIRAPRRPTTDERPSLLGDARAGVRLLFHHTLLRPMLLGFVAVVAFIGVDDVALVFLAEDAFGASDAVAAVLYAGVGVGLVICFVTLLLTDRSRGTAAMVVAGLFVASAGNVLTGVAPAIGVAFLTQVIRGVGNGLVDVGTTTTIQRSVPVEMQGRVFANFFGSVGLAVGVSYLVGGPLVDALSARAVLVLGGAGGVVATLAAAVALRDARRRLEGEPDGG
jgi:MFS family permease